jgi:putative ABC transport system substrate-binding protein
VLWLSALLVIAFVAPAEPQQPEKIARIGFLSSAASQETYVGIFRQELKKLGYIEGKNIAFEHRSGGRDQMPNLAAELVSLQVNIIVANGADETEAAKNASSAIPIVMTSSTDPVGLGFVSSLARPGGNITGLTSVSGELGGKTLQLLKEIVPKLARVAIPAPAGLQTEIFLKQTEASARVLGIQLIPLRFYGPEDFSGVFRTASRENADAFLVRISAGTAAAHRRQFIALVAKSRLPAIYTASNWVDAGGLMSYGPDRIAMYRRAATYVDKILKGSKPGDLPVEAPTKFEMVVNLKTAKEIGVTIPQSVLYRADKLIK